MKQKKDDVAEMVEMNHLKENTEDDFKLKSFNIIFSENSKLASRAIWPQVLLSLIFIFLSLSTSMSASHSAILLPQLKSENRSVSLDDYTASWIASSYAIAGPVGCIIGGINADIFGRKKMTITGCLGMITGWILILVAQDNMLFIVARIIEGICKGLLNIVLMVTVDESADPKYRGSIVCSSYIAYTAGLLFIATLGATVDWWTATLVSTVFPVILLILCSLLPETSTWLVRKYHIQEAHKVLQWFWGDHEVQAVAELQTLIDRFHPQGVNRRNINPNLIIKIMHILQSWRTLLSPHALKPFIINHIFKTIQVICGYAHFIYYSVEILLAVTKNSTQEFLNAYISNVVLAIVRIVFVSLASIAIYHVRRRKIALISGVGCSSSLLIVTVILYIKRHSTIYSLENWIIFIMILLFNGFYSFGFFYLPTLIIGETQPAEVRALMSGYFFTINDFIESAVIKNYYSMLNSIGIDGLFLMFALSCFVCTVFVYFFLPETHGKSLLEIEAYFHQKNILWRKYTKNIASKDQTC